MHGRPRFAVLLIVLPAVAALGVGVWAGLARIGLDVPAGDRAVGLHHGGLMVGGFVATVIGVERALSSEYRAALLVPALSAAGAVALLIRLPAVVAPLLFVLSGAGLLWLFASFLRRQFAPPLLVMGGGAAFWLGGNLVWLAGSSTPRVLPWWIAFLVLTIAGERLELTRFQRRSHMQMLVLAVTLGLLIAGVLVGAWAPQQGQVVFGVGLVAAGAWLVLADTARRTIRRGGVATYAAIALLAAYAWLVVAGAGIAANGLQPGGWMYDAVVHAFFLGFVFGAIFAHAPIIFPAISGIAVRFTLLFYLALVVLHSSLALRVLSAPLADIGLRQLGGALNGSALLLLAVAMLFGIRGARLVAPASLSQGRSERRTAP